MRLNLVDSTLSVIPLSLDTVGNGTPRENPDLEEYDVVHLFPRTRFEPVHQVEVQGAVRDPGALPRFDGMTLRDAILRSGGLIPETYTGRAFISRLQPDSTQRIIPIVNGRAEGRKGGTPHVGRKDGRAEGRKRPLPSPLSPG